MAKSIKNQAKRSSGAAGTGKDSVVKALREAHPEIEKTVSATTRAPRPGEQEPAALAPSTVLPAGMVLPVRGRTKSRSPNWMSSAA